MSTQCPDCMEIVHPKANKCKHCGKSLNAMPKSISTVIILLGIALVLVGLAAVSVSVNSSHPMSADAFYDAIKYGGIGAAIVGVITFVFGASKFSNA